MSAESKCVYIIDDDNLIRQSVYHWLSARGYVPRSFSAPLDFVDELECLTPGCALLDVRMPVIDGIQMLEQYGARMQHLELIMMTGHADVGMAVTAMKLGATDFIEKPVKLDRLTDALENAFKNLTVRLGKTQQTASANSRLSVLTPRELEILQGLCAGLSNKLIAFELNISVRTVEMHRANAMKKLGVRSQGQLIKLVLQAESKY